MFRAETVRVALLIDYIGNNEKGAPCGAPLGRVKRFCIAGLLVTICNEGAALLLAY